VQRIERIKNLFTLLFQGEEIPSGLNISTYIKSHISEDYSMLSHLFSSMEGITIEKYFISLKIGKVKEWLFYEELTLSEMAYKLDYSSVQHLSSQFKKITGMTPSEYRKLRKDGGIRSEGGRHSVMSSASKNFIEF
jgi:AraC-like DNA-binding protein